MLVFLVVDVVVTLDEHKRVEEVPVHMLRDVYRPVPVTNDPRTYAVSFVSRTSSSDLLPESRRSDPTTQNRVLYSVGGFSVGASTPAEQTVHAQSDTGPIPDDRLPERTQSKGDYS